MDEFERERLELERAKNQSELALKKAELKLKKIELRRGSWRNPLLLGILAATIGLVGNIWVTYEQGYSALELESIRSELAQKHAVQEFQSNLIVEAIKTGDPELASRNLAFLIGAGLVDDPDGRITQYISDQARVPVLPPSGPAAVQGRAYFNRSSEYPDQFEDISRLVKWLAACSAGSKIEMIVLGYSDGFGPAERQTALAADRAGNVAEILRDVLSGIAVPVNIRHQAGETNDGASDQPVPTASSGKVDIIVVSPEECKVGPKELLKP